MKKRGGESAIMHFQKTRDQLVVYGWGGKVLQRRKFLLRENQIDFDKKSS